MFELWNRFYSYLTISNTKIAWIVLFSFAFFMVFELLEKTQKGRIYRALFSVVCSAVFVMTLFGRKPGQYSNPYKPFELYLVAFGENVVEQQLQIIMNIVMYIPFGFLLFNSFAKINRIREVLYISLMCSTGIEIVQSVFKIGFWEFDDIINNVLGAMIGAILYKIVFKIREKIIGKGLMETSDG